MGFVSENRAALLAAFVLAAVSYSAYANYQYFVVEPREAQERAKKRGAEEMAKDPLFADVRYENDGTVVKGEAARLAAEENTNKLLREHAAGTAERPPVAQAALPHEAAPGLLRLTTADGQIVALSIEIAHRQAPAPTEGSEVAPEELSDVEIASAPSVQTRRLRDIVFDEQLKIPLRYAASKLNAKKNPRRAAWETVPEGDKLQPVKTTVSGKGKAYFTKENGVDRELVDVVIELEQTSPTSLQARVTVAQGAQPRDGALYEHTPSGLSLRYSSSTDVELNG